MADLPIPFSPPMVRAILREIEQPGAGKTQTRRFPRSGVPPAPATNCHPLKVQKHPAPYLDAYCSERYVPENPRGMSTNWCWWQVDDRQCLPTFKVAYKPGDRLWLREEWKTSSLHDKTPPRDLPRSAPIYYTAQDRLAPVARYRPPMFMPRWASRLTLYVTDVRVERLQDISEADAIAEGAYVGKASSRVADSHFAMAVEGVWFATARAWYADLWDRINGPGSWEANPWVAAYTFVPRLGNIDTLPATLAEAA